MQWHWGNIGSALAGLSAAISAAIIAIVTLIRGPAALADWRARQQAQAEAAREQAETTRLNRRRGLDGWNPHGVETYGVTLVTDPAELGQAVTELTSGHPTAYAILRVSENSDDNSCYRPRYLNIQRLNYLWTIRHSSARIADNLIT